MTELTLALNRNADAQSLIRVSELLLSESLEILRGINLEELDNNALIRLAKSLLNQSDQLIETADTLNPIAVISIKESIIKLRHRADEMLSVLAEVYVECQRRIYLGESEPGNLISFSEFSTNLGLRLLQRASAEPKLNAQRSESIKLITDDD